MRSIGLLGRVTLVLVLAFQFKASAFSLGTNKSDHAFWQTGKPTSKRSSKVFATVRAEKSSLSNPLEKGKKDFQRFTVVLPLVSAIVSFSTFGNASHLLHGLIEFFARRTFEDSDGGRLTANLLTPAINGPVIVSVSILFATLVSTTVSNLFTRQQAIRACLVKEVEELRYLNKIIVGYPDDVQEMAKYYVDEYTLNLFQGNLLKEPNIDTVIRNDALGELVLLLNHQVSKNTVPGLLISQAFDSITRIQASRAERMAEILSVFPACHYVLLVLLACAIATSFLLETDVEVLFFLGEFQLRMLWAALIGTFTTLAVVCYDLSTPFGGVYNIVRASDDQLKEYLSYAKNEPLGSMTNFSSR